ncbi:hypothetical protein H6G89_15835 [Oscillatoria sp. FACHB-1407]|uniref:hypothetical protein n=1 Tax=Oscillatoria sp. FACHB-1407 TaxID=2692847 RepID=UPI001681E34B|nr:hypothetical protein [Oscillatoria sp. FACHB-1407]MBD2462516.1 hypothetical protein [Oscillatoria sp. FACHB-1407]
MASLPFQPTIGQYMSYLHQQMIQTANTSIKTTDCSNPLETASVQSTESRFLAFLEVSLSRQNGRVK